MNFIRGIISFFMVILFCVSIAGFVWVGGLPPAKALGGRLALGASFLAGAGCLGIVWRYREVA